MAKKIFVTSFSSYKDFGEFSILGFDSNTPPPLAISGYNIKFNMNS